LTENNQQPIRIVGLSGSLSEKSLTRRAVEIALEGAKEMPVQTRMLDLNDYQLSFLSQAWNSRHHDPGVLRLRADIQNAQGIILGTPEYHGSLSGVLKFALDLMGFDEFEGKMVGLIGVAGGKLGATNSLNSLRTIGRSLHAWVVPQQVSISEARQQFDEKGNLKNPSLESNLKEVGRQVARFASLHNSAHAREFMRQWETAPENPGG
jgi:NAD(P)H-dependent FMN reductase